MTTNRQRLNSALLPELYSIISDYLPPYAASSTLLALALTDHYHLSIILPILNSRLVLKSEEDAFTVLQNLADDPSLGRAVREVHIMSHLSVKTRSQSPPLDVVRRMEDVILTGRLPLMHTLHIHLTLGWHYYCDKDYGRMTILDGFGRFSKDFFPRMQKACPRLRCLILEGFSDYRSRPWFEESGIWQLLNMAHLSLGLATTYIDPSGLNRCLQTITPIAHSLHTLHFTRYYGISTTDFFTLELPKLRSLWLSGFGNPADSEAFMAFFGRHPLLEHLNIASEESQLFSPDIPQGFLPNLRHLSARYGVVRCLGPILKQLSSLTIERSSHAQIPNLLRESVLQSKELPYLKSLAIGQKSMWYETLDGNFGTQQPGTQVRSMWNEYMRSIVCATPNLEELAFFGDCFPLSRLVSLSQELKALPRLRHLYYTEHRDDMAENTRQNIRDKFSSEVKELAVLVPGLHSITHTHRVYRPYLTAQISRDEDGGVADISVGKGYGMKIGYDDCVFPWAPVYR